MSRKKKLDKTQIRLILGEFLKEKRVEADLSQKFVSDKLKLTNAQFVSNIERGVCPVPFNVLDSLCQIYKINPKEIITRYLDMQKVMIENELRKTKTKLRA